MLLLFIQNCWISIILKIGLWTLSMDKNTPSEARRDTVT